MRRTSSARALAHSTRCRDFFDGGYRDFALGTLGRALLGRRRPMSANPAKRARRILFGLGYGALAGWIAREAFGGSALLEHAIAWVAYPVGQVFLRMLFIAVLPLVVSSLALGVFGLGDVRRLGRVGALTLAYTLSVSAISVAIGVALVNAFRPGDGFDPAERARLLETLAPQAQKVVTQASQAASPIDALLSIVPRNPFEALVRAFDGEMLGVMFFAVLLGVALVTTPREKTTGFVSALEGLYAVSLRMIDMAMTLAPYGVFALVFSLTARLGGDILVTLGRYVAVVLVGLALQQFGVYSLIVRFAIGIRPALFFARISEIMTTAFSTSSSAATLPTALRVSEQRLGVPREINSFVLTVGATANQNGTALFEGVTVLVPRAALRRRARARPAGDGRAALDPGRRRHRRRARRLAAADRGGAAVGRRAGRGHRRDPRRRPPARHVAHRLERDRRRDRGAVRDPGRGPARLAPRVMKVILI